jgi:hypothetical protein
MALGIFVIALFSFADCLVARDAVEDQNVPRWVADTFRSRGLDKELVFATAINLFYLRGDFDGDGKFDVAVLVVQKSSKKLGIAIFHRGTGTVAVLGAGRQFGHGGDDFRWMNVWTVYEKQAVSQGVGEGKPPNIKGEAILVEKSESASALIYWTGKSYVWYQQGD